MAQAENLFLSCFGTWTYTEHPKILSGKVSGSGTLAREDKSCKGVFMFKIFVGRRLTKYTEIRMH